MDRRLFVILSCAMLLFAAGCKEKNTPEDPGTTPVENIAGNVSKPSWSNPDDYDMTSSLTAIVKVDLSIKYPEQAAKEHWAVASDDLLAAFAGESCIGVAELSDGLFWLYVTAPENNEEITIKYYSSKLKNIFVSEETFPYRNDYQLGTVSAPYSPAFVVAQ